MKSRHPLCRMPSVLFAGLFCLLTPALCQAQAARRVALVIGNSNYESAPLANPSNDADEMAATLQGFGFSVTKKKDLNKTQIEDSVDAITENLQKGDLCLIFFAGHGLEMDRVNYLVPLEATLDRPQHVKQRCVTVSYLLDALRYSECSLKVIVVDACRTNPFRSLTRSTSGLARLEEAPEGTIVSFSTSPRTAALDGTGRNSPYVKHLSKAMRSRADQVEIVRLFREASRAVRAETGQIPYLEFDATMPDYFLKSLKPVEKGSMKSPEPKQPAPVSADSMPSMAVAKGGKNKQEFTNSIGMKMRLIPAGEFTMGLRVDLDPQCGRPLHRVQISEDYYAGVHEVTIRQFAGFLNSVSLVDRKWADFDHFIFPLKENNGRYVRRPELTFMNDDWPISDITWKGANAFCDWLSDKEGRTYRLPTEAEWEYMARAGSTTAYPWGDEMTLANGAITVFLGDGDEDAFTARSPVGSFRPNAFGLYDTAGNVAEWCSDWYQEDYYRVSPRIDPVGPDSPDDGYGHVVRGGDSSSYTTHAMSGHRSAGDYLDTRVGVGLRVVCEIK